MAQEMDKRSAERCLHLTGAYDQRVLRKAYAREARRWHPDLQPDDYHRTWATRRMAEINEAYAYLKGLFEGGAKTLTAERGAYGTGARGSQRGAGTNRGSGSSAYSRRSSGGPPEPRPPVVVHEQPAGAPVAPGPEPEPEPEPPEHCLAFRIVERFPWRIAFLVLILALFVSPAHAGWDYVANFGRFQWITLYQGGFLDFVLWQCVLVPIAVVNLFNGMVTDWVELVLLEIIAWLERLAHRDRTLS